jgi:aspartate aminotransferase-like enzyme
LMIPPGLAYCAISERAWNRMPDAKQPRYYFDLAKERKSAAKGEASYTPSVALVAALGASLDYLAAQAEGDLRAATKKMIATAETCAAMTRAAALAMQLELFAPSCPAAAVTAVKAPAGASSSDIAKAIKSTFGATVADGQGEMKGQLLRIAHLGYFDYMDTLALIGALEHVLRKSQPGLQLGRGLQAAQEEFAGRALAAARS